MLFESDLDLFFILISDFFTLTVSLSFESDFAVDFFFTVVTFVSGATFLGADFGFLFESFTTFFTSFISTFRIFLAFEMSESSNSYSSLASNHSIFCGNAIS